MVAGETSHALQPAERAGVDMTQIRNLLVCLYFQLKASEFNDLARLEDVLKLHDFFYRLLMPAEGNLRPKLSLRAEPLRYRPTGRSD
jgi:hypothetical protein